ncbi:unnamed protein product [Trifolium pratense]|uniref:Uncharacterized protein n=1 Tax=Trifolium pratense TaxID=57577 RepID=A0ACB0JP61_TRIPR|nr:unnamed protein product [Trifolium pratense]
MTLDQPNLIPQKLNRHISRRYARLFTFVKTFPSCLEIPGGLDDLCVRFLMNGPKEDLETAERICFRVEEAQWYYEDFIRPQDPTLPSMTLKCFCDEIFAHCPLLLPFSQDHRMKAFDAFLSYKKRVPVRGAIMLNENMDKLVLVKGWKKGANWSFPRGKINKDEDDLDCAIREVYEETGFDLGEAGFVPADRQVKSIELNMHEQQIRLFVFRGIPMNTHFEPRTRKEISAIDWWQLSDLPTFRKGKAQVQPVYKVTNFYMVAPFLAPVRRWIAEQRQQDASLALDGTHQSRKRTVFAQSPMPASPQVSKAMFLNSTPKMHHTFSTDTTIIPRNEKYSSPKLTSHTISLLNSFKSHNHSLPPEASIKPNSEVGMNSRSSKDPEFNYTQEIYRSSNFIPPQRQIEKPSTFHGLKKDQFSQNSAPDGHKQLRSSTFASDIPTMRKGTQSISPSDKGFLLSYLNAVVAKGTNF